MKNLLAIATMLVVFGASASNGAGNGLMSGEKGNGFFDGTKGNGFQIETLLHELGHGSHGLVGNESHGLLGDLKDGLTGHESSCFFGKERNGVSEREGVGLCANSAGARGG